MVRAAAEPARAARATRLETCIVLEGCLGLLAESTKLRSIKQKKCLEEGGGRVQKCVGRGINSWSWADRVCARFQGRRNGLPKRESLVAVPVVPGPITSSRRTCGGRPSPVFYFDHRSEKTCDYYAAHTKRRLDGRRAIAHPHLPSLHPNPPFYSQYPMHFDKSTQ